jgi:hypothetical protein
MLDSYKDGSAFQAIWQWCRGLTGSQPRFGNCGDEDVERMAHDLGVSTKELHQLASHGPKSADLLLERLTALDLDENEVARTEPATFQDMQRVCTMCDFHRRCARDLARDPFDPVWRDYCPNAPTLTALNTTPWAGRREW